MSLPPPPDAAPADPPRFYQLVLPSGGRVQARFVGEGDPVQIHLPGLGDGPALEVTRETAWGLWVVLSDALLPDTDAVPDWCHQLITPTDQDGTPLPDPIVPRRSY
ncbi:hypothetical protein Aple_010380 [Acrocarpospora pleiomorpha]|uniref:Uncharacterized protein n=1 Tax=Acrocarpospora pleiomorpha TaxID=90975 RepID=A0A5M3XGL2_9ACTN|nr:hypothetical protein [Acrocarpospora pleiomorpha]GES18143.1 hypothetical protein Aple_010380 [Acrocarpospora pleiomorpha]